MNIRTLLAVGFFCCVAGLFAQDALAAKVVVAPGAVPAQPDTAIFYPDAVQVTVKERLRPDLTPSGEQGFVLTLPGKARRDGFFVTIGGAPAPLYYWLESDRARPLPAGHKRQSPSVEEPLAPEDEPLPERRALLEKRLALKTQEARLNGELASIAARLALWSADQSNDSGPKVDDLVKLDALLAERMPALHESKETNTRELARVRVKLTEAEEELQDFDRTHCFQTVIVPFAEKDAQPLEISYGYTLPATSAIMYRLNAQPAKESLTIDQDVSLRQDSGFAWKDVDVSVSTSRRETSVAPGNPVPWRIALRSADIADEKGVGLSALPASRQQNVAEMEESAAPRQKRDRMAAPVQEEMATFRLWKLGRRSLDNDAPVRLPLASDTYKAAFNYTLRPALEAKGFLTADLSLSKPLELPRGAARLLVDTVSVGERAFAFNGDKGTIFFGSDPQVTAVMRDRKRMRGEQGLISKEKTELWHWEITLKSTRPAPVKVRVEDPAPQAADEVIKLSVQSTPKPEEVTLASSQGGTRVFRWECTLKPGEPVIIDHKVQAAVPSGKELDPGRGIK